MKKVLLLLLVVFVANLGCKKLETGGGLCACSPTVEPLISFVVKGSNNVDLLNPTTNGYFESSKIKLYYLDTNGAQKQLNFFVRPNFNYGNTNYAYYQLNSEQILRIAATVQQDFYLVLGDNDPIKFTVNLGTTGLDGVKVSVGQTELVKETGPAGSYLRNIYLINLP